MRFGDFEIKKIHAPKDQFPLVRSDVDAEYNRLLGESKQLILGTLIARSGTRWLCDIFSAHSNATGVTERNAEAESFYRFITYNKLPIDTSGIMALIKSEVILDWQKSDISLTFSPYFSHGLLNLVKELSPTKVIIGVAEPKFTVQSIYNKDVFTEQLFYKDYNLALGYQPNIPLWSHYFGRLIPKGDDYLMWVKLTRIGKIAWWGNKIMRDMYDQIQLLPADKVFIFNLHEADQNYDYYKKLAAEFKLDPLLTENNFLTLKEKTVKKTDNVVHEWTAQEKQEFETLTQEWQMLYTKLTSK